MTIEFPDAANPRVSVMIAASSNAELLHACLHSLAAHTPQAIAFEVLVLLNDKTAELHDGLLRSFSGLRVHASPVNLGVAGAVNRLRSVAGGEYLITLHDDAEITPGWMEALVAAADAHPQAGAVGSKVLDPDGRLQSAGMILWRDGLTSPPWIGSPPDPDAFRSIRPVDYCGTASLLVRARAWDVIGGADENLYPAYYVDVDLAMSLRRHGWSVILAPESVARHHRGSSSSRRFQQFVAGRNRRVFLKKWAEDLDRYDTPYAASSAAIKRALARAEALATDCVRRPTDGLLSPSAMPAYDRIGRERRNHERNLALQKEYVASLGRSLDVAWPKRLWPPRRIPRTPRNLMRFLLGLPL